VVTPADIQLDHDHNKQGIEHRKDITYEGNKFENVLTAFCDLSQKLERNLFSKGDAVLCLRFSEVVAFSV